MKKNFRYIILLIYLIIAFFLIKIFIFNDTNTPQSNETIVSTEQTSTVNTSNNTSTDSTITTGISNELAQKSSATIIVEDLNLETKFAPGQSVYDIMLAEKNSGRLNFEGKNFPGLGFFVDTIGSLKENKNEHLIYFINGKSATVGISVYLPKDKDVIEWKLK